MLEFEISPCCVVVVTGMVSGFSLNYDPALLTFVDCITGSGASGAAIFVNTVSNASGKIGVAMVLPADATFPAGTRELIEVKFFLNFLSADQRRNYLENQPTGQISDPQAYPVPVTYTSRHLGLAFAYLEFLTPVGYQHGFLSGLDLPVLSPQVPMTDRQL